MPTALPNIYCTPNDVYDQVGIEAAQLRLDDQNLASGQTVTSTASAAVGATSITIAALQYGLLKGTRLVFSNAAMDAPVEVTLSAAAAIGATTLTVTALATAVPSGATAIDNGVNVWLAGLMTKACRYATAQVQLYCLGRYDDSVLVTSWNVNQWATRIAAHWLAKRLYRTAPEGTKEDYDETMEQLKGVQSSELNIAGIGTRTSGWPFISNVTMDLGYNNKRVRVEPLLSEPTPTQYPQAIDYNSYLSWEF